MKRVIVLTRSRYSSPTQSNSIYLHSVEKDILRRYPNAFIEYHLIDSKFTPFSKHELLQEFKPRDIPSLLRILLSVQLFKDILSINGYLGVIPRFKGFRFLTSVRVYLLFAYFSSVLDRKLLYEKDVVAFVGFGYYSTLEMSFMYAASFHSVDFIDYQHGIIHAQHTPYSRMAANFRLRPSYIYLWDNSFKRVFPKFFASKLCLSSYSKRLSASIASLRTSMGKEPFLNGSRNDLTIFISLCWLEALPLRLVDFIKATLEDDSFKSFNYIFRMHPKTHDLKSLPGEFGGFLSSAMATHSARIKVTDNSTSLLDDIACSDIHLTIHSSVAVQCSISDHPTITFAGNRDFLPSCFDALPLIYRSDPSVDIDQQIFSILTSLPSN